LCHVTLKLAVSRSRPSVTTYVGKPSAIGHPTNPTQPAFHPFGVDEWVVSCNLMSATSVRGGAIW